MRDPGWYWAKYAIGCGWCAVYWDGLAWWEAGCSAPHKDSYFYHIEPKIEQPKEQSDE